MMSGTPEVAFYYPGPVWRSGDWIKNLILFFDGVALLVPEYMKDRPAIVDPAIEAGLREEGLLHIFEPEYMVDQVATERLTEALADVIASGMLDTLAEDSLRFQELSYSRMGGYGDPGLARMLLEELKAKGLARESEDGVSIPMHPLVRALILVLLAQILRPHGKILGMDLSPATDRPGIVAALTDLLSLPSAPSAGQVVSFDMETVGVDLGAVPIDEVLDFRRAHISEHRAYARTVRRFVRELSLVPEEERSALFDERQAELDDLAQHLKQISRKAWRKPAAFALSLAGAAWSAVSGNPLAAVLGAGGSVISGIEKAKGETGAYSYLFRAHNKFA